YLDASGGRRGMHAGTRRIAPQRDARLHPVRTCTRTCARSSSFKRRQIRAQKRAYRERWRATMHPMCQTSMLVVPTRSHLALVEYDCTSLQNKRALQKEKG